MHAETEKQHRWRSEFDAMSPAERLMAIAPNPHEVAPSGKVTFWRALHAQSEALSQASHEEQVLSIAKEANRLAKEANEIAWSQTKAAWRAARYAMYAAVIAAIAAVASYRDQILALLFGSTR